MEETPQSKCPACNRLTLIYRTGYPGQVSFYVCSACRWEPRLQTLRLLKRLGRPADPDVAYLIELFSIEPVMKKHSNPWDVIMGKMDKVGVS